MNDADPHEEFLQNVIDTGVEPFLVLHGDLRVRCANRAFYSTFKVSELETVGRYIFNLGNGQWDIPALRTLLQGILPNDSHFDGYQIDWTFPDLGARSMLLNARKLYAPNNHTESVFLSISDVTNERGLQRSVEQHIEELTNALERERRITAVLQRPLTLEVPSDAFPGLTVATLYSSVGDESGVGGDFFDAIPLPDGRTALLVGDASGKGLAAAARATEVKDVLRAFLRIYPHYPASTMTRVNDYLCEIQNLDDRSRHTFIALSMMVVNLAKSEAVLTWGGIGPPLIVRGDGSIEVAVGGGLPLGTNLHEVYTDTTISFMPGDSIILCTDGLTEARRGKEFLDQEGVIEIIKLAVKRENLRDMADQIISDARNFAGGKLQDDACLVIVRRL